MATIRFFDTEQKKEREINARILSKDENFFIVLFENEVIYIPVSKVNLVRDE